ncbi:MAG: zinc ribbon domain-containing protein [Actinomycetota bacterium]|jgi:putative FmdB family regulatory protein|nr:zinc ribbon domain-containing protein [Actinomycetota bacterium]
MEGRDGVPVYDFGCERCGPFEQRRSLAEAGDPMACPSCGKEARRVYSMPNTRRMPVGLSKAMDRSEKSAYEPEVVRRPVGGTTSGKKHQHSHGRPWALGH